jgi:hypothetical protein
MKQPAELRRPVIDSYCRTVCKRGIGEGFVDLIVRLVF